MWWIAAALALFASLGLVTWRANELFSIKVERGRAKIVRGRCPPRLRHDLEDVVRRRPALDARIRVVVENRMPTLRCGGDLTDQEKQQLRNVIGQWPLSRLRP